MRQRRPAGFTLVEVIFAVTLFGLLVLIVFEMFVKGNKTASKATWRVHAQQAQRLGLRQAKELLQASSYPTVIRIGDFIEVKDGYRMGLGDTASVEAGAGTSLTSYGFTAEDWIMRFYSCQPCEDVEYTGSTEETRVGTAAGVALQLVPRAGAPGLFELWVETARADVSWDPDAGDLVVGDFGTPERRRLMYDVESVSVLLPTTRTADGLYVPSGSVVELGAVCVDPWDRRMRLRESTRVEVNVEIDPTPTDVDATFVAP